MQKFLNKITPENLDYFEYLKNAEQSDRWDNKQVFSLLLQALSGGTHAEK